MRAARFGGSGCARAIAASALVLLTSMQNASAGSTKPDWKTVLDGIAAGASEGMASGQPQESIEYKDDKQLARDVIASMKAGLTSIRVAVPGFDTEEMVPGVLVFTRAVKDTGGSIKYCKKDERRSGIGSLIVGFAFPYVLKEGKDFIASEMSRAQIPELAKRYDVLAYVRADGRTADYIEFKKRGLGSDCDVPAGETGGETEPK